MLNRLHLGTRAHVSRTGSRLSRDATEHRFATHIAAVHSLGIASSIVPAPGVQVPRRYSLREFTRISKDREVVALHQGHTPD
jgi:hypothetical protein